MLINEIGQGKIFGELAFLSEFQTKRSATILAGRKQVIGMDKVDSQTALDQLTSAHASQDEAGDGEVDAVAHKVPIEGQSEAVTKHSRIKLKGVCLCLKVSTLSIVCPLEYERTPCMSTTLCVLCSDTSADL